MAGSKTAGHSKSAGGGRGTALGPVFPNRPKEEGGVEFEIERAVGDADQKIDPEQMNLF